MLDSIIVGDLATNCYLLPLGTENACSCVVVDPGGDADRIITRLRQRRWRPELIALTHGHFDHIAALAELMKAFSGGGFSPIIAIHALDAEYLGKEAKQKHLRDFAVAGAAAFVENLWRAPPPPTWLLAEGDMLGLYRVLHVPGHTPGSVAFYNEADGVIILGDLLFADGVGRTDLPGGDDAALNRGINRILALPPSVTLYPGHGRSVRVSERARFPR